MQHFCKNDTIHNKILINLNTVPQPDKGDVEITSVCHRSK